MIGLASLIAGNAAALLVAHALWRRIRTGEGALDVVLFVLLRILVVQSAVLVAGMTGTLRAGPMGLAALVVLGALFAEYRHVRLPRRPELGRWTAVLAGALLLRMLLQVWFLAPYSGDALAYHLPKIGEWIRAGAFTREMGLDSHVTFPAGFELVETWWAVFLHHDVLIEMAGVEFAVLAFASVAALARGLGLAERPSFLAAALYILTPLVSMQATACYNDAPAAALVLATAALCVFRADPALVLLPVALLAGVKGTGLYALPAVALLWPWSGTLKKSDRPIWAMGVAALSLAVGGYWYVRNLLWFGNPVHPLTREGHDQGEIHVQAGADLGSLARNFSQMMADRLDDHLAPYTPLSYQIAGWGLLAFALGLPALVQGIREDRAYRRAAAAFTVALLTVFMMVSYDGWYARFVLFFPAILTIGIARLCETGKPIAIATGVAAVLTFGLSTVASSPVWPVTIQFARQGWRERTESRAQIPPGEAIALYTTRRTPVYPFYQPDFGRRVLYLRIQNAAEMEAAMRREGVRYVYVDVLSHHRKAEIAAGVQDGRLQSVGPNLYRLAN